MEGLVWFLSPCTTLECDVSVRTRHQPVEAFPIVNQATLTIGSWALSSIQPLMRPCRLPHTRPANHRSPFPTRRGSGSPTVRYGTVLYCTAIQSVHRKSLLEWLTSSSEIPTRSVGSRYAHGSSHRRMRLEMEMRRNLGALLGLPLQDLGPQMSCTQLPNHASLGIGLEKTPTVPPARAGT